MQREDFWRTAAILTKPAETLRRNLWHSEGQTAGRQIPDARNEQITEQRCGSEHRVREATGIGILFFDPLSGRAHQQTIQYIWCLVHSGRDDLCSKGAILICYMGMRASRGLGGDTWPGPTARHQTDPSETPPTAFSVSPATERTLSLSVYRSGPSDRGAPRGTNPT